jgi:ribonucleoside-diphosphate reductase alpha chain
MKVTRRFTRAGQDVFAGVEWERRTSRISNPDGTVVFEMADAEVPRDWSQLATDIMVSKYFRKAGVPQTDEQGNPRLNDDGTVVTGPERSARQVIRRLAGCWRFWGQEHGYFDTPDDAQAFEDELSYMLVHQMCAPNSPQWFNTGLHWAYGITGPAQGHYYCDPRTGELRKSADAYSHPQPHACFIQSVSDDLVNPGGIMDLWTREARLFKYGSGTGSNFSRLRGENEPLSGGGKSSGLMSFLKIGDRAAGAIKSGGTTRRAAKMVCLDLDHPDIEMFVNWKVREELKVAALAEGIKVLPAEQRELARKLGLKLDYDFNGEAYYTVSGQNSNNSVRIPNRFFEALEADGNWELTARTTGKVARTVRARDLWDQIAFAAWRCADPGVQYDDTINQWHTCPESGRINASNPCVTGDTRVLTPGGIWRRIDSMIHLPSRVVTNLNGQEIHVTEGSFPTGVKDVFELTTSCGYQLKLTADHKVWTRRRGWVAACDLATDDEVRLPAKPAVVREVGEPQEARFFHLLGAYLSTANHDLNALHLDAAMPPDLIDDYARYVAENWGETVYDDDYADDAMLDHSGDGGTATAAVTNRRLISRLRAFIRLDPYTRADASGRRLTDDAFTAGLPAQKHILRALFTADAGFEPEGLTLRSDAPGLLRDVHLLLLGFGVTARLIPAAPTPEQPGVDRLTRCGLPGLRIEPGSLGAFLSYIGFLPGASQQPPSSIEPGPIDAHFDRIASLRPVGQQPVYDLTEPSTHSFVANGITVHNCSEYMFLDDTACNLASLNVLKFFDAETRRFDIEGYKHAIRLWTIVLEISVLMASFPSEEIARLSYRFRTLGLGYANLGAMLMQAGIPYDSDKGRAICAALTAILTGESYATSAEMARQLGPFPGFAENRESMLKVIRNHRRAAYDVANQPQAMKGLGDYEGIDRRPVGIDASQFSASDTLASRQLLQSALECWDRALFLGDKHGYRNAQTTVIAPTGTIGLLMDCDTTGVEPDFALVKFKKLAGGGYFKIANQSLRHALINLGYEPSQIAQILRFVMGTMTLEDAPHINVDSLKLKGFTAEELERIEASLPGQFELAFAFSPWNVGEEYFQRAGIPQSVWQEPGFNLLRAIGFSRREIDEANDVICGRGTVEGAPHLKPEHYAVFDCANRCGKHGKRFIAVEGHIRMMAAAQPFISGAISKTINLPNEATVDDIKAAYELSWKLGLKANALYRDGSKLSQPLNIKSDVELEDDEADELGESEAREELARDTVRAVEQVERGLSASVRADNLAPMEPVHTHIVEKIVERIVERPLRRRLPDTRNAVTHKFDVAGHEGYITVGLYEDGSPGEIFIRMSKEGSTIGGLMDTIATLVSVSLQYGVPVESLVRKFEHTRFEPSGMTSNRDIPMAKSLVDYIFRWLAMEFIPGYRATNAPKRGGAAEPESEPADSPQAESPLRQSPTDPANGSHHVGNGQSQPLTDHRVIASDRPGGDKSSVSTPVGHARVPSHRSEAQPMLSGRIGGLVDPVSQQGAHMQSDAPPCDVCGAITVRNGTCYKCQVCGNSMGCS